MAAKTRILLRDNHPPLIVAEMSGNHNQSLEKALAIVEAAAKAKVDAVKLQTYTADTLTLDVKSGDFYIDAKDSLWKGNSLHSLYQNAYTPWEWHRQIFKRCKELGLECFSTPFDETAVDFLEELGVPYYKVASFENSHLPLLKKIAQTKKPIIISTGMATLGELEEAVRTLRDNGSGEIVLLKCTSSYPASPENSNLLTLPVMREVFGCQVGLSDHTMGVGVAVASVALGAKVIEKHFTLDRSEGGVDAAFSMEPAEMSLLVEEVHKVWLALGSVKFGASKEEAKSLQFRRSLYVATDMKKGEKFSPKNLRIVRPGFGLHPRYYEMILGSRVNQKVAKGTPVTWELLLGKK